MFITKLSLPRRTFLRGMGVTLALPLLESMVPALTATAKTAANPQRRFGAIFVPLGERPGFWTPKTVGANFEFTPILKPLEPFRDHVTIVSELCDPLDGHATTVAAWLSGVIPKRTIAEDVHNGITIDQVIAKQIGGDTVYPVARAGHRGLHRLHRRLRHAVRLRLHEHAVVGERDRRRCRWRSTRASPSSACSGGPARATQRLARMQTDRASSTRCRDDVKDLQGGLGPKDKTRLSDYLENVREIEARIQKAEKQATTTVTVPDAPIGVPESFEEHVGLQFDLLALAYEANVTNVFTFMMSRDASQRVYPNIGIAEPHHSMSHHGNNPEKIANLVKLNTYHMALFAKFVEKLNDDAGRRRLAARSFADPVRQRHERERHPLASQHPDGHRRRRRGAA